MRLAMPSLARTLETWTAAVFGEMKRRPASSALREALGEEGDDLPLARGERLGPGHGAAEADAAADGLELLDPPARPPLEEGVGLLGLVLRLLEPAEGDEAAGGTDAGGAPLVGEQRLLGHRRPLVVGQRRLGIDRPASASWPVDERLDRRAPRRAAMPVSALDWTAMRSASARRSAGGTPAGSAADTIECTVPAGQPAPLTGVPAGVGEGAQLRRRRQAGVELAPAEQHVAPQAEEPRRVARERRPGRRRCRRARSTSPASRARPASCTLNHEPLWVSR